MSPILLADRQGAARPAASKLAMMEGDLKKDDELLRAHRAGDRAAFAELYDRHDRPCYRFIRRLLGARHEDAAEDLHQETWMAISRNADAFDPLKASFRGWLFTIARRKTFDYFRRQKAVFLTSEDEGAAMAVPDARPGPFEHLQSREFGEKVIDAVQALPLAQREVFLMFADAGLSLEEISILAGVGVETTKSRLRYARAALRRALAGERSADA